MRKQKLLKKSSRRGNLLAALLMVTASLLYSGSLWAAKVSVYSTSGQPYLYSWLKVGETRLSGNWPGTLMTQMSSINNNWYQYEIDNQSGAYYLIWNRNNGYQTNNLGGDVTGDVCGWFYEATTDGNQRALNGALFDMSQIKFYGSCWDSWATAQSMDGFDSDKLGYYHLEENLPAGTYTFRVKWGDDWQPHTVSTTRGNYSGITKDGNNGKVVLANPGSIKFYFDPGTKELFADVTETPAPSGDAPTVLLGANPEVTDARATLHGYLKFTGCNDVNPFGFVWSTNSADIDKAEPTGTFTPATSPEAPITVGNYGTEFELEEYDFDVSGTQTIYYKAYATNAVGTSYSAMGQFETSGCDKPVVNNITLSANPVCDNAGTITATANNITDATYAWEVDGTSFTAASGETYQASITVGEAGTGSISVTPTLAGCVGNKFTLSDIEVKSSAIAAKNLKVNGESTTEGQEINFCQGDTVTLKITSDDAVTTYTWNFPEGWTIKSGSGTKEVVVTASATSGTVTATISNACGKSDARTINANVTAIPATPGTITGDATACRQTDHTYTIEAVADAAGYEWILPAGWSGECGATGNILNARAGADATSGTIKVKATNSCGSSAYNTGKEVTVSGYSIVITGMGAKSAAATYPWELFNLTATTEASTITWNQTYTGTIAEDLTVFKSDGKTATLKSGAPVSDTDHYTVTASTTEGGCETTSDGYDVYINAAPVEECN